MNNDQQYIKKAFFLKAGKRIICLLWFVALALPSCKKFVTINVPDTRIVSQAVFATDASATAAVTGIYINMMANQFVFTGGGTTIYAGLSADEFRNYSTNTFQKEFYSNALDPSNTTVSAIWDNAYNFIYNANAVLEGLSASSGLSVTVKNELEGEARFIRSFCYFYLVNFFGDVPLITGTDYQINASMPRTAKDAVYSQIKEDLLSARSLLTDDYSFSNGEKVRPNKWAATALLARVYLYTNDWQNALLQSDLVINSGNYELPTDLNTVFLKNSQEAIWQLYPVRPGVNTNEGSSFNLTAPPTSSGVGISLSDSLYNNFEAADLRKINWVNSFFGNGQFYYYPFKYKVNTSLTLTEYYTVFRLAEQYLIRAEARAELNDVNGAIDDIRLIRSRAGLSTSIANSKAMVLSAVLKERRLELFAEWGHRWLDLKRTNTVDSVMTSFCPQKGGVWNAYKAIYPLPSAQVKNNPATTQNPGY